MARNPRLALRGLAALVLAALAAAASAQEMRAFGNAMPSALWALPVGAEDAAADEIDGISVDPNGNTVIAGVFRDGLTLGTSRFSSRGAGDVFLASISPGGQVRWARQFGGKGDDNAFDVTTDGAGNIIMSGWFAGSVDFGGQTLKSAGGQDQFVTKYDSSGTLIWARRFGGPGGDGGNEIAVTASGEIAVAAITEGDFEAGGRRYAYGGGQRDSLVLRLSPSGEVRWVVQAAGPGTERIRAMSMTEAGDVFVGFQYQGTLAMAGARLASQGGWDGAFARLLPDGALAWMVPIGGRGHDGVRGVGATADGHIYASGIVGGRALMIDREIPAIGEAVDYIVRVTPEGKLVWLLSMAGPGPKNNGGEMLVDGKGVIVSSLMTRQVTVRRNRDVVGTFEAAGRRPTSYLAGFTHDGRPRFVFRPEPQGGGAGALGDVLSVSRDGRYLAQALRFRGTLGIGGARLSTPGERDSAVLLFQLNGA